VKNTSFFTWPEKSHQLLLVQHFDYILLGVNNKGFAAGLVIFFTYSTLFWLSASSDLAVRQTFSGRHAILPGILHKIKLSKLSRWKIMH